jgi:protein involved in polysaccharide export with SLBB domain
MPCPPRWSVLIALLTFTMPVHAQDPPNPPGKVEEVTKPPQPANPPQVELPPPPTLEFKEVIKPLPPVAIPDDPPPHEGAFFDLPITIEPPDIVIVEVLEALPGMPITGERLVRPDGTISLGFYGDLYVRGLTPEQVKVKVLIHLRKFLNDEVLGLVRFDGDIEVQVMPEAVEPTPPPPANPIEKKPKPEAKPIEKKDGRPSARLSRERRSARRPSRRGLPISAQAPPTSERQEPPRDDKPKVQAQKPEAEIVVVEPIRVDGKWTVIPPAESTRVFVDITSYNAQYYYVQGDVGVPGRLPITGKETVLDALNYAGGLVPSAEPNDIHLYRPARGGKPAKDYKIDLDAIHKGVVTANLQVFPNDRLIVGRNAIVKKTVEIDRANGLITTTAATARDALIKDWAEFLWSITAKDGGAMLDEKAFKEALMKKLTPPGRSR